MVEASADPLNTVNATLGNVVERQTITTLPLNGRNPLNLIVLEPGVTQRSGTTINVNGMRAQAGNVTIDGIEANEASNPTPTNNVFRVNPDNVEEFKVTTSNPTPEEGKNYDNRSANRIRAAAHAFEAKCFVVVVGSCLDQTARDWVANGDRAAASVLDAAPTSESFFVDPTGMVFGDATTNEGLVFATINLRHCIEPKRFHDVAAGYNRFDLFDFRVRRERLRPAHFDDVAEETSEIVDLSETRLVS